MLSRIFIVILAIVLFLSTSAASSQEPPWLGRVVVVGEKRAHVSSLDIFDRPYRPFHFYGNARRREHYRGSRLPMPRDWGKGLGALVISR